MNALVVAHRGASGHRPEHTEAGYRLGYRLGADSVEPDVVATKDGVLVCRHDLELSRTTDIADRPDLAHLRRTVRLGARAVTGWFVHDLTYEQLRELRCRERWPRKRPGSASYDGQLPVLTLAELVAIAEEESARAGRHLGIHAEIKHAAFLETQGLAMTDLYCQADSPHITWMSFESDPLRKLVFRGLRPGVQLTVGRPRGRELAEIATYAAAVGVRRRAVYARDPQGNLRRPTKLVDKAHRRGLDVLVWTLRSENKHLPPALRVGDQPNAHGHGAREAQLLLEAGVDGLIGDYPEVARAAVEEFSHRVAV